MARPARARPLVLAAARDLLARDGPTGFTLDGVASEAGLSKGGVFYHFSSREALLSALVRESLEEVDAAMDQAVAAAEAAGTGGPGVFTRAYLKITVGPQPVPGDDGALVAALIAALALEPSLLAPISSAFARWQAQVEADGLPIERATTARLAIDGWWLTRLVGAPLSAATRRTTLEFIESLALGPAAGQ
jgi:AcrR family transcriptional regulator